MAQCFGCERTDIKCCPTCARNPYTCNVWHLCDKDCEGYELQKQTNFDRIKAMSVEELAKYINPNCFDCADVCGEFKGGCAYTCTHNQGKDFILKWLKSEVNR